MAWRYTANPSIGTWACCGNSHFNATIHGFPFCKISWVLCILWNYHFLKWVCMKTLSLKWIPVSSPISKRLPNPHSKSVLSSKHNKHQLYHQLYYGSGYGLLNLFPMTKMKKSRKEKRLRVLISIILNYCMMNDNFFHFIQTESKQGSCVGMHGKRVECWWKEDKVESGQITIGNL